MDFKEENKSLVRYIHSDFFSDMYVFVCEIIDCFTFLEASHYLN